MFSNSKFAVPELPPLKAALSTTFVRQPGGVIIPLPILQEIIADTVFVNGAGLSTTDMYGYFSGPAFLPWNRMGNIDSW